MPHLLKVFVAECKAVTRWPRAYIRLIINVERSFVAAGVSFPDTLAISRVLGSGMSAPGTTVSSIPDSEIRLDTAVK